MKKENRLALPRRKGRPKHDKKRGHAIGGTEGKKEPRNSFPCEKEHPSFQGGKGGEKRLVRVKEMNKTIPGGRRWGKGSLHFPHLQKSL